MVISVQQKQANSIAGIVVEGSQIWQNFKEILEKIGIE